jgi:hypothetical protein
MHTVLKTFENLSIRVGKKTVTRIALYSRVLGSNVNITTDDGYVSTWLLADAPDAIRDMIATTEPTAEREIG